ncbi:MAG: PASTA domain-containing protein [Burkholderiales bacterium]
MSDNNGFLSNYGKNMGEYKQPPSEIVVKDVDLGYKFEEKSGFKKPELTGGPPPSRRPQLLIPIIAGSAVVVALIVILLLVLGGGIKVIDFKGMSLSDAELWANQNGVLLNVEEEFNDEFEASKIIAQSVEPDKTIKKGEFLTLTVSKGHDLSVLVELPDIMSMTMDEVQAWADKNFMSKVRITSEYNDTVPANHVIRYEINDDKVAGDKIRRDTPLYVIVSKGSEDESMVQVTVPDFKAMSISESYIFASQNGITLIVEEQYDDYVPKGTVISQSVKSQEKVAKGTEIKLVVSKGKKITIPDFSDYSKDQAAAVASTLGIPVTINEKYSNSKAGVFLSQSIEAGTVYEEGDYIELNYSLGNKIQLASFVGQTRDAIESWANDLNTKGANITIKVTETQSSSPKGTIIYQDVANTMIGVKKTINITVSLGKIIYMPDFVDDTVSATRGYDTAITREEAIAMCDAAGIVPVLVPEACAGRLPGEVWYQSIPAGAEVSDGTSVTLKFVPVSTVTVPNFLGSKKDDIRLNPEYVQSLTITFVDDSTYDASKVGIVVSQSIVAGTTVPAGTAITLNVGPQPPSP